MKILVTVAGLALLAVILLDTFEAIVLPRRVTRRLRLTSLFYRSTWRLWSAAARRMRSGSGRETYISFFGPLSLLLLLVLWAGGLILGFAMLHWGLSSRIHAPEHSAGFGTYLYLSGTTFYTLGLGDVTPRTMLARTVTVTEAGVGFGFLAVVISYLPVLYGAFSRREVAIALLDARAGSPPSAAELLRRYAQAQNMGALDLLLRDWEQWSAELLESHLSYPVLVYYRSQHDGQSWLASLTSILDACALVIAGIDAGPAWQAKLTFAMARHAIVDLALIFGTPPRAPEPDRLPPADLARLREILAAAGAPLRDGEATDRRLAELRRLYEPYVNAFAAHQLLTLPGWMAPADAVDNWQSSAWDRSDHFF